MISTHCENPVNGWEFSVFSKALAMQLLGFCVKFFEAKTVPLGFQTTGPTEAEYSLADSIFNTGNIGNPCHGNFIHEFLEKNPSHEAHFESQNINSSLGLCYTHVSLGFQYRSGPKRIRKRGVLKIY